MAAAFAYIVATITLLVLLQAFAQPLRVLGRIAGNSLLGGCALWLFDALAQRVGFHLGVNLVSAVLVGTLGLPGFLGLCAVRFLVR
ncbi:MAG: pro-sigmaK processing inhibitor BofA family protein [Mycobacterium leprae]